MTVGPSDRQTRTRHLSHHIIPKPKKDRDGQDHRTRIGNEERKIVNGCHHHHHHHHPPPITTDTQDIHHSRQQHQQALSRASNPHTTTTTTIFSHPSITYHHHERDDPPNIQSPPPPPISCRHGHDIHDDDEHPYVAIYHDLSCIYNTIS